MPKYLSKINHKPFKITKMYDLYYVMIIFFILLFRNLLDCDVFSKSDPICVVYMKTPEVSKWNEICRTECINNSLNPDFVTKVIIIYLFI